MRTQRSVERELAKANKADIDDEDPRTQAELYGVRQALEWVLERDAMAPTKCASLGWPGHESR